MYLLSLSEDERECIIYFVLFGHRQHVIITQHTPMREVRYANTYKADHFVVHLLM
jgi:hypothetical protein